MERLRGQLRDTAQYGQRDEFGGDTLEDTAMGGFRRGTRGVERLLKGRKQGQKKEKFQAQNNSGTPSDAPSTGEKRGAGSLRIKTREAVLEQATAERGSGIVRPRPGPEKVRTGAGSLGSERPVEPCAVLPRTPRSHPRRGAEKRRRNRSGNALKRIADSPRVPHIPLPRLPRRIVGPCPQSGVQVNSTPPNKGDVAQP